MFADGLVCIAMRNTAVLIYPSSLMSIGIVDLLHRGRQAGLKV